MGKSFEQFLHLDEVDYKREIFCLNENELRELQASASRKTLGASAAIGASLASIFLTGPLALISGAVSIRRLNVNDRRLDIINARMEEKGWAQYEVRKRDLAAPVAAIAIANLVVPGADALLGHFASHATTHFASTAHVATSAAAPHGAGVARVVAEHPEVFMRAVQHGAETQIAEITNGAIGHVASVVPVTDLAGQCANSAGYTMGEALTNNSVHKATSLAVKCVTKFGVEKVCNLGAKTFESERPVSIVRNSNDNTIRTRGFPSESNVSASRLGNFVGHKRRVSAGRGEFKPMGIVVANGLTAMSALCPAFQIWEWLSC